MKKEASTILLASGAALFGLGLAACAILLVGLWNIEKSYDAVESFAAASEAAPFVNTTADEKPDISDANDRGNALYSITAPEGFRLNSYSEHWDEQQLQLLYDELKKNRHGPEIETLNEISVLAESDDVATAMHTSDVKIMEFALLFGALPEDFHFNINLDVSNITLYGGDENQTVESMARSLSHEYGHLYTFYYMLENDDSFGDTEYAALRGWKENDLVVTSWAPDYWKEHYRYLAEVAADDYVQLMGSPTTRTVAEYTDVRQMLGGAQVPDVYAINTEGANGIPQENLELPLASEVPELAEYFYSFLGETPPMPVEEKREIELQIAPGSTGFDLTTGYQTFVYYTITWNTPYEDAIYTVGCYDPDEYMVYPVKTVHTGQQAVATVGTVTAADSAYVYWQYDGLDSGTKVFYVVAQLPDGTYYLSERLEYTF